MTFSLHKNILADFRRRPAGVAIGGRLEAAELGYLHQDVMDEIARLQHRPIFHGVDFTKQRPRNRQWLALNRRRALATYFLVVEEGYSNARLALALGLSRTAVGKALARVEDARASHEWIFTALRHRHRD